MTPPTNILVIRLSALGDVAMTVPVLQALVAQNPAVRITMVSKAFFKPLFSNIPNVSFLEADVYGKHKGLLGLWKLAKAAKKCQIDAVADLHNVIRSQILRNYLRLFGIKTEVLNKGRAEKKALTRAQGIPIKPLKSTHQRYADVFRELGYTVDLDSPQFQKRKPLTPRLLTLIGKAPQKLIGIAPFAAYPSKMYPLELMREVLQQLNATQTYRILLFGGGKKEEKLLKKLSSGLETVSNVANALPFEEELTLISNLDVMLSMDSGNGHLAALFGVPVLTLWGVTHPFAGFTPYHQPEANQLLSDRQQYPLIPTSIYGNAYPKNYERVMGTIPVSQIIKMLERILYTSS